MTRVGIIVAVVIACAGVARAEDTLTIDQAVQLALTRNERARISDLNVVVAEANVNPATLAASSAR